MNYDEARASLIGSKKNNKTEEFELEIKDKDIGCNKDATEACPVQVIRIE
jgi:ferredoxin